MRASLPQFEAFYWTLRYGSVRAAAEHLNLTQPTVTLRLQELEKNLGVALFERAGRRLRPSRHGAALRHQVEQLLSLAGTIERYGRDAEPAPHLLRIGTADIFAHGCLPRLLSIIDADYPNLQVEVSVAFSRSINRRLLEGELDLAFLTNPEGPESLVMLPMGSVEVAWVAAPSLGLGTEGAAVRPADLVRHRILTNPEPSHLFASVRDWFAPSGLWPERLGTCDSLWIMARLAAAGLGVALLPAIMPGLESQWSTLRVLATDPPIAPHRLYAAFHRDNDSAHLRSVITEARALLPLVGILPTLND
jgi:DNA-binding transcriptional LysR family regulator